VGELQSKFKGRSVRDSGEEKNVDSLLLSTWDWESPSTNDNALGSVSTRKF